ncbi:MULTISPECIES: dihydrodipicolinate reductase [unclassified Roseivivax]|uniref:dihydrodipicolinate reductase n=1 Tax=Roseivivax sp. GX 12232 TaxID=2900547 RepID=UPI001E4D2981|nr:dihydrodipicolinate reductase [Roseivivax sp. GX 12232]MCE0506051.1 dihydrodipicolinate reductase [Roseivivax sp. GX 12232]
MRFSLIPSLILALMLPAAAAAERVDTRAEFLSAVEGKRLVRPLVNLQVLSNGGIAGNGAAWDVTGNWTWQDGFFCRDLNWGGDDLGYNCQLVELDANRITFTADRGAGRSEGFTLK